MQAKRRFCFIFLLSAVAIACSPDTGTLPEQTGSTSAANSLDSGSGWIPAVTTQHNDNLRSGTNTTEITLGWNNVNWAYFGFLNGADVDGQVFTQPLYVPGLSVNGATHNATFVATENDTVYAFDADNLSLLYWNHLVPSGEVPVPAADNLNITYRTISPTIGITGTPVIDLATNTMYVVTVTAVSPPPPTGPPIHIQRLHALDITNGLEKTGSPVVIAATVQVNGRPYPYANFSYPFDPGIQNQRAALLLTTATLGGSSHKVVYIGWGSYNDGGRYYTTDPLTGSGNLEYRGWVMAYTTADDAQPLAQKGAWCNGCGADYVSATLPGTGGGIWQAGGGLAADANGDVYFMTGNGMNDGVYAFADAALRLHLDDTGLKRTASYTPPDAFNMLMCDADFGSSGPVLLPDVPGSHPHQMLGGGKTATLFLWDRDQLSQAALATTSITGGLACPDTYNAANCAPPPAVKQPNYQGEGIYHIHGQPVVWGVGSTVRAYVWGEQNFIRSYQVGSGSITPSAYPLSATSATQAPTAYYPSCPSGAQGTSGYPRAMPGGILSLSANGGSNGILWAALPTVADDNGKMILPGALRAFRADTLGELWDSDMRQYQWGNPPYPFPDRVGNFAKFVAPTIANGKVYVPSFYDDNGGVTPNNSNHKGANRLQMYGPLPATAPITAYWDPANATQHVLYPAASTAYLQDLSCGPGGCWNQTNLGTWGTVLPYYPITSFFTNTTADLFFNLGGSGEGPGQIYEYYGEPITGHSWLELTSTYSAVVQAHASFWDGMYKHIYFADGNGQNGSANLHEMYSNGSWVDHTIPQCPYTGLGHGPRYVSAYYDGTIEHVIFDCRNDAAPYQRELWETYYHSGWTTHSIATLDAVAVSKFMGGVTGGLYGFQATLGLGPMGSNKLEFTSNSGGWNSKYITVPSVGYNSSVLVYPDSGGLKYFFTGADRHVYELFNPSSPTPSVVDLSTTAHFDGSLAGSPLGGSDLAGYYDGSTYDHVFFIAGDGFVHEFYGHPADPPSAWWEHPIGSGGAWVP